MEKLLKLLQENGYEARIEMIEKETGEPRKGLIVFKDKNLNIGKVFYDIDETRYDFVVEEMEKDGVQDFKKVFESVKNSKNFILCARPKREDDFVTRDFLDIQLFVKVDLDNYAVSVSKKSLEIIGISEDELFDIAEQNSLSKLESVSMAEILGVPIPPEFDIMHVVRTNDGYFGASAIKFVGNLFDEDMYIFPSSVHEIICLPISRVPIGLELSEIRELVLDGNSIIREEEILSDNVYAYRNGKVEIVSEL